MDVRGEQGQLQQAPVWLDGFGGQEDELQDVHNGILTPPTDDEDASSLDEANGQGTASSDSAGPAEDDLEALERRAGLRPM